MAKQQIKCPRCNGKGVIPRYYYNKRGICFLCWGRKTISADVQPGETKEQAFNRMREDQKRILALQTPKVPIPGNMKNPAFDDAEERNAFKPGSDKPAMNDKQINEAIAGLKMVSNLSGMGAIEQMAKDAGVKVGGDLFDSIRKHLETGGNLEKKDQPKADGTIGRESTATTERGTTVQTRYKVIDAANLIPSNDLKGNINPAFPKELQPRDRTRTASKLQVEQIANELDFNRLGESALASNGAPIVAPDNVVESGNGRILGVQLAYDRGNQGSQNYKNALIQNAKNFGIDPEAVKGMDKPVLVRERISDVDRLQFVVEANESGVSSMSAAEQAKVDADALTSFVIDQFEGGDLKAQKNKPFVNAFMQNVVSAADRNKFITEKTDGDGVKVAELSKDGEQRIKNAMFAKAYDDPSLLTKKAELDDESNVKNVLNVMEDNAVDYAKLKAEIKAGALHPHDLSPDLVEAVKKLDELRANGDNAINYLNQPSFFGSEMSEEARALLFFMEKNKRNKSNIDSFMKAYMDELRSLGDPNELDMFAFDDSLSNDAIDKKKLILTSIGKVQPDLVEETNRIATNTEPDPIDLMKQGYSGPEEMRAESSRLNDEVGQMEQEVKQLLSNKPAINGYREYFEKILDSKGNEVINVGSFANEYWNTGMAKKPEKQLEYIQKRHKILTDLLKKIKK